MRSTLLKWADRLAGTQGCRLIPEWRLERLSLAEHLRTLFRHYGITTVLDVGANRGQYRDFLRSEVDFEGEIHSFEPLRGLCDTMRASGKRDPRWHVHNCALGAEPGEATINVMASDTFTSLRTIAGDAPSAFVASAQVQRTETVVVRRLDDLAGELGLTPGCTYLKVDTQGFDLEVLKGASRTLPGIGALQVELAIQRIYQGVPDYREVLTLLERMAYGISAMFLISSDQHLRAVEFDCVLIREPSAPPACGRE